MFLIRTLLSQGTILCIVLLLVTLDVGFSTAKATTKPGKLVPCPLWRDGAAEPRRRPGR